MILVEGPLLFRHRVVVLPRLRNHHHHGFGNAAAGLNEQLEAVVEVARIRAFRLDDREQIFEALAERLRRHHPLAGERPVRIAAQRVDLAVVGHVAQRLRTVPTGERVRREPTVDHRQVRRVVLGRQVREVRHHLVRREHSLVDDHSRRQRADVERQTLRELALDADGNAGSLADEVQLAFERGLVDSVGGRDEQLLHVRFAGAGRRADVRHVRPLRHVPPAEQLLAVLRDQIVDDLLARLSLGGIAWKENDAGRIAANFWQRYAQFVFGDAHTELVRQRGQHARTVAGVLFTTAGAAVLHVSQDAVGVLDDAVRAHALDVRNEPHAAVFVLVAGVVQTVRTGSGRQAEVLPGGARDVGHGTAF